MPAEPRAVPVAEAAALIGVGRTVLYAERKAGRIRFVRIGGKNVVRLSEIDAYLERRDLETNGVRAMPIRPRRSAPAADDGFIPSFPELQKARR